MVPLPRGTSTILRINPNPSSKPLLRSAVGFCALIALFAAFPGAAQVITIDTSGKGPVAKGPGSPVDRRYSQITPTNVPLQQNEIDAKTRLLLIRVLQSEQGFAMRPFPRGHKGLTLVANGKLEPAGEAYLNMAIENGTSAKPGDRVVITDLKIEKGKIIFSLNGGPDLKHRILSHVEIGAGADTTVPLAQDNEPDPTGARLTLDFGSHVPVVTGDDVKALLAPLISFNVKTPIQAYTDTLPKVLKDAILSHKIMVGMNTDMVLYAKGPPRAKSREMDGQTPFEEWIYGDPPDEVDFVRINGNLVIRLEVAKNGEAPIIFTKDEVSGLLTTDGSPVITADNNVHIQKVGDVEHDPDKQAPAPAPTLRAPGEQLPTDPDPQDNRDNKKNVGVMRPVQFPKPKPPDSQTDAQPGANPDSVPDAQSTTQPAPTQPASTSGQQSPAASQPASTQPASTSTKPAAAGDSSQQPAPVKPPAPATGTNQPN